MKIKQTFKNLKRLQQIGGVFARHGFQSVMKDIGLSGVIPFQRQLDSTTSLSNAVRLRMAFEELGTTFVKLGQMLSIRPDLIPTEYVEEFRKLQDSVQPFDVKTARAVIEKELDLSLEDVFVEFESTPIGSASIAQVHKAKLPDGQNVVVKVRRPGTQQQVETDLSILFSLANMLDKYTDLIKVVNPIAIVDEFASLIRHELDFIREAQNIKIFYTNFEDDERVIIPEVIWDLTGKRVLTMTFIDGIPLNSVSKLKEKDWDKKKLALLGLETFFKMVFQHGYFHGDIHGGNLLVQDENTLGIIDFGITGQLDERLLHEIGGMFMSLVARDFRSLARHYLRLSSGSSGDTSPDSLARDLQRVIEPLMGLSLKQINSSQLMMELAGVAQRNRLQIPQELLLLFRAIATLDGIGRELDPEFDVVSAATEFAKDLMIERYSPEKMAIDLITILRDLADLGRDMPSQLQGLLQRAEEGGLVVNAKLNDPALLGSIKRDNLRTVSAILLGSGSLTLAITQAQDGFGFAGLLGLLLFLAGLGGLIAPLILLGRKGL